MEYPEISLAYLRTLTDCTGVIQHGVHSVPNRHLGYTTDDNARALIVAAMQYDRTRSREDLDLAIGYLSYMHHCQTPEHKFRNLMDFDRRFIDEEGTQDCFGRSLWACGVAASSQLPENVKIVAGKMFLNSLVWAADLDSPRARAYCLMGMAAYLRGNEDPGGLADKINLLAYSLSSAIRHNTYEDWLWYENYLTYGNAILPLGMLAAAEVLSSEVYLDDARSTMDFLTEVTVIGDRLEIIGNDGWYTRGSRRAWYDQQSIDAGYIVYLYSEAHRILGDRQYLDLAGTAYSWFFGNNRAGLWVYDPTTAGCFDAVTPAGLNLNEGSESIICFLLAQLSVQDLLSG